MLVIAGYVVVSIVIYNVLARLAEKIGRLTARVEKGILVLAVVWPLWGECVLVTALAYALFKGLLGESRLSSSKAKR